MMSRISLVLALCLLTTPAPEAQINSPPTPVVAASPSRAGTDLVTEGRAGDYVVGIANIDDGLPLGNNLIDISVSTADHVPVSDATVRLQFRPTDHNGSLRPVTARSTGRGHYQASVRLTASGLYTADVSVGRGTERSDSTTFNIKVGTTPPAGR